MASPVKRREPPRRPYRSTLRQEQAAATRERVLDAALASFREQGYAASSVRQIAERAGVAVQTLYQTWGSKPALVDGLLGRVKEQIDIAGRFAAMSAGTREPTDLLAGSARITRLYSEVGWDVLELVRVVAPEQAEVAAAWEEGEASRYRGQTRVVRWVAQADALRSGLRIARAADTLWSLSAHDVYRLFVAHRANSPAAFERWLYETTVELLLDPSGPKGRRAGPP